jgi:hypothetical protein
MTSDFGVWVEGVDGLEESIFLVNFKIYNGMRLKISPCKINYTLISK